MYEITPLKWLKTSIKVNMDTGVIKYMYVEFVYISIYEKMWIWLTFACPSLIILKPSVSGNIPHLLLHSTLQITDLFLSRTFWEWKRERVRGTEREKERGNEGWCNRLSDWRKETEISCFGMFVFWGEAKILEYHLIHKWFQIWPTKPASTKSYWQKQTGVDFPAEENLLITEGDVSERKKNLAEYKEDELQLGWKVKLTERVQLKGRGLFWWS